MPRSAFESLAEFCRRGRSPRQAARRRTARAAPTAPQHRALRTAIQALGHPLAQWLLPVCQALEAPWDRREGEQWLGPVCTGRSRRCVRRTRNSRCLIFWSALVRAYGRWRRGADHLEVGCGVGNALLAFAVEFPHLLEFPHLRVEGIDLDAALIDEARRRAVVLKVQDRVRLRQLDAGELEDEQRFDSAQWSQLFFSSASRPPALRALHRALRAGGLLLMPTLPEQTPPSPASSVKRALIASWDVPVHSQAALRAELDNAGFDVVTAGTIEPRPLLLSEGYLVARRP
jgi:ubiquinone/menaquinone biosynthesis C-methylase UbiE